MTHSVLSPMHATILAKVRHALERSVLLHAVALSQVDGGRALTTGDAQLRPLTDHEVGVLERQRNRADDWSRVCVAEGFDCRRVWESCFHGDIVLGRFQGTVSVGGVP